MWKRLTTKKPAIIITPADGKPAADPTSPTGPPTGGPLTALQNFHFPGDGPPLADAGGLVTTAGDTLMSLPITDPMEAEPTTGSTKTKSSKRDRAKKLQKRVVLKVRDLGSRFKKHLQKGKKKMKPKTPALKLKVELDNPSQMAGNAAGAAGLPNPTPAA